MNTETREQGPDEHDVTPMEQFIVVRANVFVGHIQADCIECAWDMRDRTFPGCSVGFIVEESFRRRECILVTEQRARERRRSPEE